MTDEFAFENIIVAALWNGAASDREPPLITRDRVLLKKHSGVGFFTTVRKAADLRLTNENRSGALGDCYDVLTQNGQITGSVCFLSEGVLETIEIYTYAGTLREDDLPLRLATDDDWVAWRARVEQE